jgi:hypothetical protein
MRFTRYCVIRPLWLSAELERARIGASTDHARQACTSAPGFHLARVSGNRDFSSADNHNRAYEST